MVAGMELKSWLLAHREASVEMCEKSELSELCPLNPLEGATDCAVPPGLMSLPLCSAGPAKAVVASKAVLFYFEGLSGVGSKIVGHGDTRHG
jgi:hypothetical protein